MVLAIATYTMWGVLPLYFHALGGASAPEILGWRILLSAACSVLLVLTLRRGRPLKAALTSRRTSLTLAVSGLLISGNWLVYIMAATTGHIIEASLGYFINPIATIGLAVLVLRERLRPLQWAAVGISLSAVTVLTVDYGRLPWISLALAGTFACYGLVKKNVGGMVDALTGMTVETLWVALPAAILLAALAAGLILPAGAADSSGVSGPLGHLAMGSASYGTGSTVLLALAGIVTLVPLLCFAGAASRLPLSVVGMVQYLGPILQFLIGYFVFGEQMSAGRWIGFGIVWAAVCCLILDAAWLWARRPRLAVTPSRPGSPLRRVGGKGAEWG